MKRLVDVSIIVICCVIAFLLVFGTLACMVISADEPKMEMSETLSVMVMSDNFESATGKVKFTVMNWTENDEVRAVRQEEIGRPATTGEIWLASVLLENVTVEEKGGSSGFDWAKVNKLNDKGECSKMKLLVNFFKGRIIFIFTIIILILFVAMTGAEASVVRAALMGMAMLLGNEVERQYSFRNAFAIVAAFMVLQNPRILIFDLGFQLSFAALLGIVYLPPLISHFLHLNPAPSFLGWRKNLVTTLSAQVAVLPLIATSFGSVSISGIFSNILILGLIPISMFVGFAVALTGFVSYYVSFAFGLVANILLSYILWVIKIFSSFGYVSGLQLGAGFMVGYYFILIAGVWYFYKNHETF